MAHVVNMGNLAHEGVEMRGGQKQLEEVLRTGYVHAFPLLFTE